MELSYAQYGPAQVLNTYIWSLLRFKAALMPEKHDIAMLLSSF